MAIYGVKLFVAAGSHDSQISTYFNVFAFTIYIWLAILILITLVFIVTVCKMWFLLKNMKHLRANETSMVIKLVSFLLALTASCLFLTFILPMINKAFVNSADQTYNFWFTETQKYVYLLLFFQSTFSMHILLSTAYLWWLLGLN
jgi:hypothetical protein